LCKLVYFVSIEIKEEKRIWRHEAIIGTGFVKRFVGCNCAEEERTIDDDGRQQRTVRA
jgi:hypothetical protein